MSEADFKGSNYELNEKGRGGYRRDCAVCGASFIALRWNLKRGVGESCSNRCRMKLWWMRRTRKVTPLPDRIWPKVHKTESCWLWLGAHNRGYAKLGTLSIYRWTYEQLKGPIPAGLTIDHLCRVRGCVNPDHMEAVTAVENVMRSTAPAALNAKKTHCKRGHAFDAANTARSRNSRVCRACRSALKRARTARRRNETLRLP